MIGGVVAAIALGFGAYLVYRNVQSGSLPTPSLPSWMTTVPSEPSLTPTNGTITNDPSTWPKGDKIWDICRAIANAEGYYGANNVPYRYNNPGDISDYATTYGSIYSDGSNITTFPDAWTGWEKLYEKISNAAYGKSDVYHPAMTWVQIAQKWAGNWQTWANNVSSYLGVSEQSTLEQYVNG